MRNKDISFNSIKNYMRTMNETQIGKFIKILIALQDGENVKIDPEFTFIVQAVQNGWNDQQQKNEERSQINRENALKRWHKTDEQPKKKGGRKKTSEEKKAIHDENQEIIEKVKERVESYGLVYKAGKDEWIAATNIRKGKSFNQVAEKYGMKSIELALAIIDASLSDKFRKGKIFNCESLYYNYPRVINQVNMNFQTKKNSIGYLPGAFD